MKTSVWLRAAALITAAQCIGHFVGRPWTPGHDVLSAGVVAAMKAHEMHVMGFDRSYFDFYVGFGMALGIFLAGQAVLLWLLAGFSTTDPARARPVVAVFFAANLAITVMNALYLFTAPLVMTGAVALCLGVALLVPVARKG